MRPVSSTAARYDLPTIWFHWAVTLIVASGIANTGFRAVSSFDKLFDIYGNVLFAKIGIVAVMFPWLFSTVSLHCQKLRRVASKECLRLDKFLRDCATRDSAGEVCRFQEKATFPCYRKRRSEVAARADSKRIALRATTMSWVTSRLSPSGVRLRCEF